MIIGINGKIGSGKDTVGKIIQYLQCHNTGEITIQDVISNPEHEWWLEEQSKFEIKKFAGKLKQIGSILSGVDVEMFEDQEFKKLEMPECWNRLQQSGRSKVWAPMTYREFLQKLGTEAMREGLHTNVWVNALFADYHLTPDKNANELFTEEFLTGSSTLRYEYPNWIITDMRFPNEMEAIVEKGGITIRVVRQGTILSNHPSETSLDKHGMHYEIINDGTIEDLIEKVRTILIKENII
jgi:ABC-type oligopeptide transport system ATPase subunit